MNKNEIGSILEGLKSIKEAGPTPFAVRWTEFDKNDRSVGKQKDFTTEKAMKAFMAKVKQKDNFNSFLATSKGYGDEEKTCEEIELSDSDLEGMKIVVEGKVSVPALETYLKGVLNKLKCEEFISSQIHSGTDGVVIRVDFKVPEKVADKVYLKVMNGIRSKFKLEGLGIYLNRGVVSGGLMSMSMEVNTASRWKKGEETLSEELKEQGTNENVKFDAKKIKDLKSAIEWHSDDRASEKQKDDIIKQMEEKLTSTDNEDEITNLMISITSSIWKTTKVKKPKDMDSKHEFSRKNIRANLKSILNK